MISYKKMLNWLRYKQYNVAPRPNLELILLLAALMLLWVQVNRLKLQSLHLVEHNSSDDLPSLYRVYSAKTVQEGLVASGDNFTLNGLPIRILSGAIHYFRVHPLHWRDRLRKLRAAGFNTVETYVAWNLHEAVRGSFDFSGWLNIRRFIKLAQEEDLFLILRPGPYICSEWDFGGLPSWLLRDSNMQPRTTQEGFMEAATAYMTAIIGEVRSLQWGKEYGAQPIIAVQIENEYYGFGNTNMDSYMYMSSLREVMISKGLSQSLLFISENMRGLKESPPLRDVLITLNFKQKAWFHLNKLHKTQPHRPMMVMEYWTGWFDHWLDTGHHVTSPKDFKKNLADILSLGASVNLYMFHGGTSFGFMPGANTLNNSMLYLPDVNSYDYGAPLTEAGDYTPSYWAARELAMQYQLGVAANARIPEPPPESEKVMYGSIRVRQYIPLSELIKTLPSSNVLEKPTNMEALNVNKGNGQAYGFVLYRRSSIVIKEGSVLKITASIADILYIIIDGKMITKPAYQKEDVKAEGYWVMQNPEFLLPGDNKEHRLDLLVENMGRVNYGGREAFIQKKGLWNGSVLLNGEEVIGWNAYALDFPPLWVSNLRNWKTFDKNSEPISQPALYRATINIQDEPCDTFIQLDDLEDEWTKGQIFVNGFNLGRYWNLGPQKTSYLPGPLLHEGENEILIFELFRPAKQIHLRDRPNLGPTIR